MQDGRCHGYGTDGSSEVLAVLFVVAITFLLAAVVLTATSGFEPPEPEDAIPEAGTSPFAPERAANFAGDPVERTLYDSSAGEVLSGDPEDGAYLPPPNVDDGVAEHVESLEGSDELPTSPQGGEIRVESGGYYVDDTNDIWGEWDNERVVFDTTGGPVRIGLDGDGFFDSGSITAYGSEIEVTGSSPVEIYVERSSYSLDIDFEDVSFENDGTDMFRIYAQSDEGSDLSEIEIRDSTFRGVVYAPGSEVEVRNSEFYGASVAAETDIEGTSYYHDESLERLGEDVLP